MKLAIVGSRSFTDYALLCSVIEEHYSIDSITDIVSGGCQEGADVLAERFCREVLKKEPILFKAEWSKYSSPDRKNPAGMIRNKDIVNACDCMLIFFDGESPGTTGTIKLARSAKKPIRIIRTDECSTLFSSNGETKSSSATRQTPQ